MSNRWLISFTVSSPSRSASRIEIRSGCASALKNSALKLLNCCLIRAPHNRKILHIQFRAYRRPAAEDGQAGISIARRPAARVVKKVTGASCPAETSTIIRRAAARTNCTAQARL
jgi:hypothetical protein